MVACVCWVKVNVNLLMKMDKMSSKKPFQQFKNTISNVKSSWVGTSLVVQWFRILLPMQGTWVRSLVREDPTCRGKKRVLAY